MLMAGLVKMALEKPATINSMLVLKESLSTRWILQDSLHSGHRISSRRLIVFNGKFSCWRHCVLVPNPKGRFAMIPNGWNLVIACYLTKTSHLFMSLLDSNKHMR